MSRFPSGSCCQVQDISPRTLRYKIAKIENLGTDQSQDRKTLSYIKHQNRLKYWIITIHFGVYVSSKIRVPALERALRILEVLQKNHRCTISEIISFNRTS